VLNFAVEPLVLAHFVLDAERPGTVEWLENLANSGYRPSSGFKSVDIRALVLQTKDWREDPEMRRTVERIEALVAPAISALANLQSVK
jgi:hypothetical protein